MRNVPGYVFRKKYSHRAITLRKRDQLEALIERLVDRLVAKGFVEVIDEGSPKIRASDHDEQ